MSRAFLNGANGIAVVLKVSIDESGTHNGSPVITVGAAFSKPSVWSAWTKQWNVAKRPIEIYHAADCHNFKGEYLGWSPKKRDDHVKRLLPIISEHKIEGRIAGLHLASYRKAISARPEVARVFGNPYVACFQWAITDICSVATERGISRIAFVHENNDYQYEALKAFNFVRGKFPKVRMGIAFDRKADFVPLQCADIFAYEGNHRLRNTRAQIRKPMEILDPAGDRIGFIEHDDSNMNSFVETMCDLYDHLVLTRSELLRPNS